MKEQKLGRVLIVDDEVELANALRSSLTAQGYEAVAFTSGKDALKALETQNFELLLTDLMMPDMDGVEVLRAALEIDPHLAGILMTGQGTVQTAVEAMKIGALDYVLKPLKLHALLPVLSRAMEVRRLRMENVQLRETLAVFELSQTIAYSLDFNILVHKAADAALKQLDADEVSVMLPTDDGDELYVAAALGNRRDELLGKRVPFGNGIAGWVARRHEPVRLDGEVNDPRFAPIHPRTDIFSAVSMPMLAGGKLIGVLNANATRRHTFTQGQVKGLNILVSTAAAALQGAMLFTDLKSAEQRYRSIFENAAEGISQATEDGRFLLANPSLARMCGYGSPEELIAGVTDIASQLYVDPEQRAEFKRQLDEQGSVAGFEAQFRRRDGVKIWVAMNAIRKSDENRGLTYYEGAVEDITERKRAEEALRENKAFLTTLLNAIPAPVFYKDSEGRYLGFNRAYEKFFGSTSEQLIGKSVFDINPRELAERYHAKDAELLQNPGTQIYDSQVKDAHGALHDVVFHKATFMDAGGRVIGLIGVILDITERAKQAREIEHLNRLYSVLSRVSQAVVRATSPEKFLEQVCREIAEGGGFLLAWIGQVEPMTNAVVPTASWGGIGEYLRGITVYADNRPEGRGPTGTCIREGRPSVHNDFLHSPMTLRWHDLAAPFGIASCAAFPIERAGGPWGALSIYSDEVDRFSGEDVKLLEKVAGDIEFALDNLDKESRRKQAEDSLRESEERYRSVIENMEDVFYRTNERGAIVMASPSAAGLLGYDSMGEMRGMLVESFWMYPDEREKFLRALREDGVVRDYEITLKKKDGSPIYASTTSKFLKDDQGNILGVEGVMRDITGRKRAEEERMRLATAIEQAAEAIIITDSNWIIDYVNPAFTAMAGYEGAEAIGEHLRLLKSDQYDRAFYRDIQKTLAEGHVWSGRVTNRKKDGSLYETEATASPIRNRSGAVINYVAIHRDITAQVKLEADLRQAQKMEAIGTLAGGIAHDFNNILGIILGSVELELLESAGSGESRDRVEQIRKAALRARDLVRQILAFSRTHEQERGPMQLGILLKEVLKLLRAALPSTIEIRPKIDLEADDGDLISADATQIHQVLMNLCTNAGHAMREKGGILDVSMSSVQFGPEDSACPPELPAGSYVRICVSDTGCGMDDRVMERIFEPYFTTKGVGEGTGMGLSVVHGIVRSHEGAVTVVSQPGAGSTFCVFLPAGAKEVETQSDVGPVGIPMGKERILFVDDEEELARLGKEALEQFGYTVFSTADSVEAFEAFRAAPGKFDLVVTDQTMPQMTGMELAAELRQIRPSIPVILCTGYSELVTEQNIRAAGIQEVVMKPLIMHEVGRIIRRVLDREGRK